jgi:DNA-binding LacI/PurR family transcriptional regulator
MVNSITVKDIALHADVSVGTVSRVFNNHSNVSEEVRQRVLKAAEALGYSGPSGQRRAARQGPTQTQMREIGFIFGPRNEGTSAAANPFWSHILAGVEEEATRANLKLTYRSIGQLRDKPQLVQDLINGLNLDGLILVGFMEAALVRGLKASGRPLVLISDYIPNIGADAVMDNGYLGTLQAIEYLFGLGHQKIAFIGGPSKMVGNRPINSSYPIERRFDGYRVAHLNAGLPINYNLYEQSNLTPESGYEGCRNLLKRGADFTALFCSNDSTAIGAFKALSEDGIKIPGDVSLIGFGDYLHISEQIFTDLTTIHYDIAAMGAIAVRRLLDRFANPHSASIISFVECDLVKRGSVQPPNH